MSSASATHFTHIIKRDGGIKPFDASKIAFALERAVQATGEFDAAESKRLTHYLVCPKMKVHGRVCPGPSSTRWPGLIC